MHSEWNKKSLAIIRDFFNLMELGYIYYFFSCKPSLNASPTLSDTR